MTTKIVRFAPEVLGFDLYPKQAEILDEIYRDGIRTAVLRLGRRAGKGRLAALVAAYEATVNADAHLRAVPPGERVAVAVLASSREQARIVHGYIRSFLRTPELDPLVEADTQDRIDLATGITILTLPAHAAAVRGLGVAVVIADEAAWWLGRDGGPFDPKEVMDAIVPATATFPERRVLVLSTPRLAVGWFHDLCRRAEAGELPDTRAWHYPTWEVNPTISQAFLDAERAKDPVAFAREYGAEFEASISTVFDAESLRAAVSDRGDLPAIPTTSYTIALDPAFTGDRFALLLGHREPSGRVVVDRVRAWKGSKADPVRLDAVVEEVSVIAMAYNGANVLIDQHAAEPIRQALAKRGLRVEERPWSNEAKVDAVAAVRRVLYAGQLDLPRHRELLAELAALEQRPTPSGRPRIAAPGAGHDDYAMALLALIAELAKDAPAPAGASIEPVPSVRRLVNPERRAAWPVRRLIGRPLGLPTRVR